MTLSKEKNTNNNFTSDLRRKSFWQKLYDIHKCHVKVAFIRDNYLFNGK